MQTLLLKMLSVRYIMACRPSKTTVFRLLCLERKFWNLSFGPAARSHFQLSVGPRSGLPSNHLAISVVTPSILYKFRNTKVAAI